jgi:hypothetical protein
MTIADGNTKEYNISVFLETSDVIENEVVQFAIPTSSINWEVAFNSSEFAQNFTGFEGNTFAIDVVGQKLEFITDASTTNINEAMSTVEVAFTDTNGNIDADYTTDIDIISTGSLIGSPVIITPNSSGVAVFNNLIHNAVGTNRRLTASSGIQADIVSSFFDIIDSPELFITEVADPDDVANARYVEIYNAGVTSIDFSSVDYFIVRQANGGSTTDETKLSGLILPKAYYTIAFNTSQFNTSYGLSSDLQSFFINGNGNDAYFISLDDTNDNSLKNSTIDIYGVLDIDVANDPWKYEDSRAYRQNPTVTNANATWTESEWEVIFPASSTTSDMTPGYGDNDFIYDNGNWNNNIYLNSNPEGVSTTSQNIFIKSGTALLANDTAIGDLVVRSGATLELAPNVKLTVSGDIVNEGTIIFQSDVNGSAVLEAVQPNTRVVGNGFEIHRYIPAKRAFRYLSSAVNSTDDINANWQEAATDVLDDLEEGFGTHITGSQTGENGFDQTETGNPSMFTWDVAIQNWASIPSTNDDDLELGKAYAILIRGDRSISLDDNTNEGNETRLRSTGEIHTGDFEVPSTQLTSTDGHFNLIGNPYQSQVDLKDLLDNHSNQLNPNIAYVYDPTLGERGGYATIDLENTSFSSVPAGTTANQYLQPNQAFFVESIGVSPNLTFTEDTKNNDNLQTQTFSTNTNPLSYLNINLKDDTQHLLDGVRVVFGENYSALIDDLDALKFWNYDENLSVFSKNTNLSIEKRPAPVATDTTHLHLYSYTKTQYRLETEWVADTQENMQVFLVDQYEDQSLEITPNQSWSYHFSVNAAIPESVSPTRFLITYETNPLSLDDFSTSDINVYPNPLPRRQSLYLQTDDLQDIQHIQLLNLQGQVVQNVKVDASVNSANRVEMNFKQDIQGGVYLLKFQTSTHHFVKKIIFK